METDEELESTQPKFVVDGVEYGSYEEAQARLDEKSKAADAKFREAAEVRQSAASQFEEFERQRQQAQDAQRFSQPNGTELPDPSTDADGFVTAKIQQALTPYQQYLQQMGGAYRDLQTKYNALAARTGGVDVDAVKARVREKFADEPATASMILASPKLMAEQQQLMEAEAHADDLATIRKQKEAEKAQLKTESGATGEGGNGFRVPTAEEYERMSSAEQLRVDKVIDSNPEYAKEFYGIF